VGLIECSRSPTPLEDRDLDQLTLEEAPELVRRSREEARVKQEEEVGREQSAVRRSGKRRRCRGNDGNIVSGQTKRAKATVEKRCRSRRGLKTMRLAQRSRWQPVGFQYAASDYMSTCGWVNH
jgi:hypothetical protein